MQKGNTAGHLSAILTIFIWGTTFISTKVLLESFAPVEILFYRFGIGLLALLAIYPKRMKKTTLRQELLFAVAGLCGVTLYFLLENIGLTYTLASNAGVITSVAPFFTAIVAHLFLDGERLKGAFFLGFAAAIGGIVLISFNGSFLLELNPVGDVLILISTVAWAFYSIFTKIISGYGFHTIQVTRRIFAYGLLFMVPALLLMDFRFGFERFSQPVNLFNILFLGLGASALCFVTWNYALKELGAVKTSVYIYGVPVITIIASVLILSETVTWVALCGAALTLLGLFLSQRPYRGAGK